MIHDVIIRPALSQDIDSMAKLIAILFAVEKDFAVDAAKQRRGLKMFVEYPDGGCLFVAEHQQKIIGMCSAQLLRSTAEGGWKALVEDVVVAENFRGEGIGTKMLVVLEEWALAHGATRMDLLADRNNDAGLKFYEHTQWQRTNLIALQKRI